MRKKNRFDYNVLIRTEKVLMEGIEEKYPGFNDELWDYIQSFPLQRFGQIICNYICPDYRCEEQTEKTRYIMDLLFRDLDMDPFFEESEDTFKRLRARTE